MVKQLRHVIVLGVSWGYILGVVIAAVMGVTISPMVIIFAAYLLIVGCVAIDIIAVDSSYEMEGKQ